MNEKKEMVDLGWANDWKEIPEIVRASRAAGHEEKEIRISMHVYECVCEEGGWRYRADSSD